MQVNQNNTLLESEKEFKARNNKDKIESIINSVIYNKKMEN